MTVPPSNQTTHVGSRLSGTQPVSAQAWCPDIRPTSLGVPALGITVFGCGQDEADAFRALAPHLGVVPTLVKAPLSVSNVTLAEGSRCVSVDHRTPLAEETLVALRKVGVEFISTRSVGLDHIDVSSARRVGISVGTVDYSPDSVADFTLMLILMTLRGAKAAVLRSAAHDYRLHDVRGRELRDMTVGVVGTGRIGRAVVTRLGAFGCRILVHDRSPWGTEQCVSLDDLLQQSDVVTLHASLDRESHHLLDRRRIELMRDGAIVVNTGRGPLIETAALLSALESGRLGGAALDVLEGEEQFFYTDHHDGRIESHPLHRLQRLSNVLITPHTAYFTDHSLRDVTEHTLLDCLRFEGRAA